MLNCFQRFTFTFTAVVLSRKGLSSYEKKYDAKLYLIRGRENVQYSRKAQRTQIQEKRIFLSNVIWCSLLLCYTSSQTYQLLIKLFPFPPLSLLKKIIGGQLDVMKCTRSLKSPGVISEDVILMFDEMYLQKCEEYSGGEIISANENNELYSGLLLFLIILLFFYLFQSNRFEN